MASGRPSWFEAFWVNLKISGSIALIASLPFIEQPLYFVTGVVLFATPFAAFLALAQVRILRHLNFGSFAVTVLVTSITYIGVILCSLIVGLWLQISALTLRWPWDRSVLHLVTDISRSRWLVLGGAIAFALMIVINFTLQISRKLGPGVLWAWMLGYYHRPRQEQRVFMFLDLADSTSLGEQLGDMNFSLLIQRFFADITEPILRTKGAVSHYIGDEVVITWKCADGLSDAACVRCFFLIQDGIDVAAYQAAFGTSPRFKAGMHLGPVVTTQVGRIKSEIVFHGDVLNTTSRIQTMCNELGASLLVSGALLDSLELPSELAARRFDGVRLRGKEEPMTLAAITRGERF